VGTAGGPVWSAAGDLMMFGRPVYSHDALPQPGTPGDLCFADLRAYLVQDHSVMQIASSPHPKWNLDMTSYRVRNRVDGQMSLLSAVTGRNNSANQLSTVVTIAAR
jgi:HK97 family phage major capsid protein